jgi:hypothetical protein
LVLTFPFSVEKRGEAELALHVARMQQVEVDGGRHVVVHAPSMAIELPLFH